MVDVFGGLDSMIDFNEITTLLFDLDNTLITFDEDTFILLYGKHVHKRFHLEIPSFEEFMKLFLKSAHAMLNKDPKDITNDEKFARDFSKATGLPSDLIIKRMLEFYANEFDNCAEVISTAPSAQKLLELAAQYFTLVAATNPLFPKVATKKRLRWGGIESPRIPWFEVTVSDNYSTAKPHLEYYQELLQKIDKTPEECLMIGNDKVNDMVAGKLGIKTFLVENGSNNQQKIITTELDEQDPDFPIDASGTLEDLYQLINNYVNTKK
jgi:FMN phosphatase YigB (HAD superfamily)